MDLQLREIERKANAGDRDAARKLQVLRIRAGAPKIGNLPAIWRQDVRDSSNVWRYTAPGYATYAYVTGPLPKYDDEKEPEPYGDELPPMLGFDKEDIEPEDQRWKWEAGVMVCMYPAKTSEERRSRRIKGYATTEAGARRIVEVVCQETGTCLPR